jgi:predicted TIM-barrel fold metal-dependent hydrolase
MLGTDDQFSADPHPPEAYRALVKDSPITRAGALAVAHAGNLERTRTLNDAVLQLSGDPDGFFFPVCSVHPADGEAARAELDRVAAAGCQWIKLHPVMQKFDVADSAITDTVKHASGLRLPVLFHADSPVDANEPGKFVRLAITVPQSRLILAHAHGPTFNQLLVYAQQKRYWWWQRNVWVEISGTVNMIAGGPFAEQFLWALRQIGIDRVLFGSNYPIDDPLEAIKATEQLGFTDAELQAVMHDNAAELLQ